jgi:hypothetical protein
VIDTVTRHLLRMYLAHVRLSSIVYIGTRKRAEWQKTTQFLEGARDFAATYPNWLWDMPSLPCSG